jgi:hypothetical protein
MTRTGAAFRPRVEPLEDRTVPSTTVLTVSPNPSIARQPVTLTAIVTESGSDELQPGDGIPVPGSVQFFDGATALGTVTVTRSSTNITQGTAQLMTMALGAGTHSLTAQYSGDIFGGLQTFGSTSNAVSDVVNPGVAADITGLTKVTVQHFPGNEALVTVKHKTGQTISGPLYLEITGLPKNVHLLGKHGTVRAHRVKGSPFVTEDVTIGPGGVGRFLLHFSGKASFGVRVLEGPGAV